MLGERLTISLDMNSPFSFKRLTSLWVRVYNNKVIKKGGTTGLSRPFVLLFFFYFKKGDLWREKQIIY